MPRTPRTFIAAALAALVAPAVARAEAAAADATTYEQRFLRLYADLHSPANGAFSPEGVPYHSAETLIVEAPDYGHETTSEAFSYWIWLEANYGRLKKDWAPLKSAFAKLEQVIVPTDADQPTNSFYNASHPATFAAERPTPEQYPSPLEAGVAPGQDPLFDELRTTYGTPDVYGMHWLLDVDDWYGFGNRGDGTSRPSYLNTFQRGPQESVWETIPQPSWEAFHWGGTAGYLPLFILDGNYARQWRYTDAPDADARVVQAMYWAQEWAHAQGVDPVTLPVDKASRMGDYLRYSLFDKYFKQPGCTSKACPPGTGDQSAHSLISWYYAWGGAADPNAGWAFRIGCSHVHFGYQNPVAAWALSTVPALAPRSPNGARDWGDSLKRQLEFYQWLQAAEGAIAGGATNSWNGAYDAPPPGTPTFHGLAYDEAPVYRDPPSNSWFGWQAWSMERLAEYRYLTNDAAAGALLDKWVGWVKSQVRLPGDGSYQIPATLAWSGAPDAWTGTPTGNPNLHVTVTAWTDDVGVTASLARALIFHSAAAKRWSGAANSESKGLAQNLLDRMWTLYKDDRGISSPEARQDYDRFFTQTVYVPPNFSGAMPNGDPIRPGVSFLDLRSKYRDDPEFARVEAAHRAGQAPVFRYHRFWAQAEVAMANADFGRLLADGASEVGAGGSSDGSGAAAEKGCGCSTSGADAGGIAALSLAAVRALWRRARARKALR